MNPSLGAPVRWPKHFSEDLHEQMGLLCDSTTSVSLFQSWQKLDGETKRGFSLCPCISDTFLFSVRIFFFLFSVKIFLGPLRRKAAL